MAKYPVLKKILMVSAICFVGLSAVAETAKPGRVRPYKGTEEYRELVVDGGTYVDKTLLIKDIIQSIDKTILITRPRRWGKSTNLSMLKHFFNVEVDSHGNRVETNSNLVLFEGGEIDTGFGKTKTLPRSKIAQDPSWGADFKVRQGSHPVIFLSFKDLVDGSYQMMESKIRSEISQIFSEHAYIRGALNRFIHESIGSQEDIEQARLDVKQFELFWLLPKDATVEELQKSLKFLSRLLHKHHGKRAFILIDEYDTPMNDAYVNGYFEQAKKLMSGIFGSALKGNSDLEKGIITGILRIAKANLFSGLNNFTEDGVLTRSEGEDGSFARYYGFTEEEVVGLLKEARLDKYVKEVKAYYNGYNIDGIEIYNPWSIVSFLKTGVLEPYWAGSGGTGLLDKAIVSQDVQEDIRVLREGKSITKAFPADIKIFDIENNTATLWALLLYAGYLTPIGPITLNAGEYTATLRIPNTEVNAPFGSFYNQYLQQADPTGTLKKANLLFDAVLKKDLLLVQTELRGTDFSSTGWNLNVLHLAALAGDKAVFDAVSERHKGLLKSRGPEGFTLKDFSFLAGHDYKQLIGYKTVLEQPGWTETVLCSSATKWAVAAGVALLAKKAMRMAMDPRQPAQPALQQGHGGRHGRVPAVDNQLQILQRWGMQGLQWGLSFGIGFLSKDFAARRIAGDCKNYADYNAIDISKPASMSTLLQFEKYRMEYPNSYVVTNGSCKVKHASVASMDITPFDLKPAPVKSVKLTLCQP